MVLALAAGVVLPLCLIVFQAAPMFAREWRKTERMKLARGLEPQRRPLTVLAVERVRAGRRA